MNTLLIGMFQIRRSRVERDPDVHNVRSDVIEKLSQQETDIVRTLFDRIDENVHTPEARVARREHNIDPYWDPFRQVEESREKVQAELDEYSRQVSAADAKAVRVSIRKALSRGRTRYDSFLLAHRKWVRRGPGEKIPIPHRVHDSFWEISGLARQMSRERVSWRDLDIIQHYRAANGFILPRRLTRLSVRKQKSLVKSIRISQQMGLTPFDWNAKPSETMPLMDPMQWMAFRLSRSVERGRDGQVQKGQIVNKRSGAMLEVMGDKYNEVNFSYFIQKLKNNSKLNFSEKLTKIRNEMSELNPPRETPSYH
jgi:ribosomal protein S18